MTLFSSVKKYLLREWKTALFGSPRTTGDDKTWLIRQLNVTKKCLTVVKSKQVSCQMNLSEKNHSNLVSLKETTLHSRMEQRIVNRSFLFCFLFSRTISVDRKKVEKFQLFIMSRRGTLSLSFKRMQKQRRTFFNKSGSHITTISSESYVSKQIDITGVLLI